MFTGTIYPHFRSKEGIYAELLARSLEHLCGAVTADTPALDGPAAEREALQIFISLIGATTLFHSRRDRSLRFSVEAEIAGNVEARISKLVPARHGSCKKPGGAGRPRHP